MYHNKMIRFSETEKQASYFLDMVNNIKYQLFRNYDPEVFDYSYSDSEGETITVDSEYSKYRWRDEW